MLCMSSFQIHPTEVKKVFDNPCRCIRRVRKVILRKKESIMKLECDQHTFMQAFFRPVSNPYYAVVGEDGSFTMDGVPPGDYEIEAWHPVLGKMEQKVTVAAKGKATVNITFAQ